MKEKKGNNKMSEFKTIGDERIDYFELKGEWTKKELYNLLMERMNTYENKDDYDLFYLKLFGKYDNSIIEEINDECKLCPNNERYLKYWDYNQLKNERINVLVLASRYIDFREYDVFASYYTDDDENRENNVELWGRKKTWYRSLINYLGF